MKLLKDVADFLDGHCQGSMAKYNGYNNSAMAHLGNSNSYLLGLATPGIYETLCLDMYKQISHDAYLSLFEEARRINFIYNRFCNPTSSEFVQLRIK